MDSLCLLSNDRARRKALDSLPSGLNETYERILDRVNAAANNGSEDVKTMVQRVLKIVARAEDPMNIEALAHIVALEIGDREIDTEAIVDEDAIFYWCSSLIRHTNEGDAVELAHFTVQEFLKGIDTTKNPEYAAFRTDGKTDSTYMTKLCLTYLMLDEFDKVRIKGQHELEEIRTRFPFRRYAVAYWDDPEDDENDDELQDLLRRFFDPSKTTAFLNWTQERMMDVTERLAYGVPYNSHAFDSTTLHWAAMLAYPRVCGWLLSSGADINQTSKLFGTPLNCALRA